MLNGVPSGVRSKIQLRVNGQVTELETNEKGTVPIEVASCDQTVSFRAQAVSWQYVQDENWASCAADPMIIYLKRMHYSVHLERALTADLSIYVMKSTGIDNLQEQLMLSIQNGENAVASATANEIAARLRNIGAKKLAQDFSTTAMYGGWLAMGKSANEILADKYLFDDSSQKAAVMSPAGQEQLNEFQRRAGVPESGRWDAPTFEALVEQHRG